MNCASARNRILALPEPAALPESVLGHVNGCPACLAWHRMAIQVDVAVTAIALPPSDGNAKRRLLAQFQSAPVRTSRPRRPSSKSENAPPIIKPLTPARANVRPASAGQPLGERLARLWPAGLIAAAILVGAISWAIFGGKSNEAPMMANAGPDPMLKDIVGAKVKLDTAPNAVARVEVFAKLADTIHEEARTLSKVTPGEEMTSLARMYDEVVRDGLVPQARALSDEERRTKLPAVKEKLELAEQAAKLLLADGVPVGSDQALKDIAETAKAGRIELAKLIQGSAL